MGSWVWLGCGLAGGGTGGGAGPGAPLGAGFRGVLGIVPVTDCRGPPDVDGVGFGFEVEGGGCRFAPSPWPPLPVPVSILSGLFLLFLLLKFLFDLLELFCRLFDLFVS